MHDILQALSATLEQRKTSDPDDSYVAKLYQQGLDVILKKIGEEAAETIVAAKNTDKQALVCETADLWFHTLIMLAHCDLGPEDVLNELARRSGMSGLEEKKSRKLPS